MTEFIKTVPYYYRTGVSSRPHPLGVPNFSQGKAVGNVGTVLNWIAEAQGPDIDIDRATRDVLAKKLSTRIRSELLSTGHKGYLLKVTRYRRREDGALHPRVDGPQPIGSGNSASDALAQSIAGSGATVIPGPPEGHVYDDGRSFHVWVEASDKGVLEPTTIPYPQSLYREAQGLIVNGVVVQGEIDEELETRARKYEKAADVLAKRNLSNEAQLAINSLQRTRNNLAKSVARADRLLDQARKHQRRAAAIGAIRTALQVAGFAVDYFDEPDQSTKEVETREAERKTVINQYNNVEIRLYQVIMEAVPELNVSPVEPLLP